MQKKETLYDGFVKLESWDAGLPFDMIIIRASDSVAGLLYDATNDRVLLVRQQRAAMVRDDNPDGSITEAVAGRFDLNIGPRGLLVKEALEEAGVTLHENEIELLNDGVPMALSAGVLTERCYGAFAIIHPAKIAEGDHGYGSEAEGEVISRIWMDAEDFINARHECWRVWAFAQYLARRRLEEGLKAR